MGIKIETTDMYKKWFEEQTAKLQGQIEKRLSNIKNHEHFGNYKNLGDGLFEIKFNDGTRIYFSRIQRDGKTILLILGGNKNGQEKDIKKAKAFIV